MNPLPDLSLLCDQIVERLQGCAELAPLSAEGYSAIVGVNDEELMEKERAALARFGLCVAVRIERAVPVSRRDAKILYDPVELLVEISERVPLNATTPASQPPGLGTGLPAWAVADRVYAALTNWSPQKLKTPFPLTARPPGLEDHTPKEEARRGLKCVRLHLQTACRGEERSA